MFAGLSKITNLQEDGPSLRFCQASQTARFIKQTALEVWIIVYCHHRVGNGSCVFSVFEISDIGCECDEMFFCHIVVVGYQRERSCQALSGPRSPGLDGSEGRGMMLASEADWGAPRVGDQGIDANPSHCICYGA